jgi:bifunctional UDP-N-acetylglucosamine pyrophosphorylase/glucosamine-1-phosphate N-acetyltransferase
MIDHVIVMAATPGRKMEALTRTRPKAMLPLLGRPLLSHVMDGYYDAGIRRFTVIIGEHEGMVAAWLSTNWHQDVRLEFAMQGHQRGTASALFAARKHIDGPFIVAPCDILIPEEHVVQLANFLEAHSEDSVALSVYYAPDDMAHGSSVLFDPRGNAIFISESPSGIHQDFMTALPIYAFAPNVIDYLDKVPIREESGEFAITSAIQLMIDDHHVVGALETGWRLHINEPDDLLTAHILLMANYEDSIINSPVPSTVKIVPPVHIDAGVTIGAGCEIGPNVYLESGTLIGKNCTLSETVVLARQIGSGQKIHRELLSKDR